MSEARTLSLDPHYEWCEVQTMSQADPTYRRGRCRHLDVVPVESGGQQVAQLCLTCDAQLLSPSLRSDSTEDPHLT